MKHVLGIDPGNNSGAAVLLSKHDNVVAWWTWKRLIRKAGDVCRVDCSDGNAVCLAHMWEIGDTIARYLSEKNLAPTFALERLFVPRPRRGQRPVNPQSVIPLAEARGELIGGLRMRPTHEPLATDWRWRQLSLPNRTRHDAAEQAAINCARHAFTWPKASAPQTKAEKGALAEAAFIARDGWVSGD